MKKIVLIVLFLISIKLHAQSFFANYGIDGKFTYTINFPNTSIFNYWEIEYGPVGFVPGTGTLVTNITTLSKTISINPFEHLDIRAKYYATSFTSPWSSFITPAPVMINNDYSYNFETAPLDAGWRGYLSGATGQVNYQTSSGQGNASTSKYIEIKSTYGNSVYWVTPRIEGMTDHKLLSFYLKGYNGQPSGSTVTVGTFSNPYDPATFHTLSELTPSSGGGVNWNAYTVTTGNYNGTDEYIAFKVTNPNASTLTIGIDTFVYKEFCEPVTNLSIASITENTAQLSFDTPYDEDYRILLTSQTNGGYTVETASSPYILENLLGNVTYTVKITTLCSATNTSIQSAPVTFTTPCNVMEPGYHYGFDPEGKCWSFLPTTTPWVGPFDPANSNTIEEHDGYMLASRNGTNYYISRYANLETDKRVRFYMTSSVQAAGSVVVGTMADPANEATFMPLQTIPASEIPYNRGDANFDLWKMFTVELANYDTTLDHHHIAFKFNNISGSYYVDDFYFENIPDCKEPVTPSTVSVTHDTAVITWQSAPGSSPASYLVEYGPAGFTHGTGTVLDAGAATTLTISNIELDNTIHDVYIKANCGSGFSAYSAKGQFRTRCTGVTPTYADNFENIMPGTKMADCWSRLVNIQPTALSPWINVESSNQFKHSGNNAMVIRSQNIDEINEMTMLVSPRLIGLDSYKIIKFWAYFPTSPYGSSTPKIMVGTLADPANYLSYTNFQTIPVPTSNLNQWVQYTIDLSAYDLTDEYIAIKHDNANQTINLFVDDFEYLGQTCPQPDYLVAQVGAGSTISLSWNANTGVTPQSTEVQVTTGNIDDGYETTTLTTTQNPFTYQAASGATYGFRVRNLCDGGIQSEWSNYVSITTGCEKTAPYYENFDNPEEDEEGNYDGCWLYVTSGEFSEYGPGPAANDGLSSQPNVFMMTEGEWLVSPMLLDMDNNKKLRFYIRTEGFADLTDVAPEPMIVGTLTVRADLSTFVPYENVFVHDSPYGREVEIDFSGYTGIAKYIAIKHPVTQVMATYSYIDDILYFDSTTCPPPFNASVTENTDTTATIGWQEQEQVTEYHIEYGPQGFTPGTGTVVTDTGIEKLITGLQTGTEYDYYIKSACGAGFSDIIVGPRTFTTACPSQPLPWSEKFNGLDAYGINALPDCFRLFQGSVNVYDEPFNYTQPNSTVSGTDDTTFLRKHGALSPVVITPTFDFVAGTTYSFSMKAKTIGWNDINLGCKTGRGNKHYNMDIEFPWLINFSAWEYTDVKYIYTPLMSGTYSFMFSIGDSYNEFIMDDFAVAEGYTSVIDVNEILFDFEGALPPSVILEGTNLVTPYHYDHIYMPAASPEAIWIIAGSGRSPLNDTLSNIWEANENFITKINTKVDASQMQELHMSFDLKQSFNNVSSESVFRVIVNGEMLGGEIMPQTQSGDDYQNYEFDLTPYAGGDIRISLQHIGRGSDPDAETGDFAWVDNLRFTGEVLSDDIAAFAGLRVYPNPVKNSLTLENLPAGSEVEVITLTGQVITKERTVSDVSQINMGSFASGIYFVKIIDGLRYKTIKIVKR